MCARISPLDPLKHFGQAWSLLEALSAHEPEELDELLQRMSVPEMPGERS
jgi:hypothetical protein